MGGFSCVISAFQGGWVTLTSYSSTIDHLIESFPTHPSTSDRNYVPMDSLPIPPMRNKIIITPLPPSGKYVDREEVTSKYFLIYLTGQLPFKLCSFKGTQSRDWKQFEAREKLEIVT
jgi:hypothetical protein